MAKSLADKILPRVVRDAVLRTLEPFIARRANGKGVASYKTQDERRATILLVVAHLWMLGYRIRKLESLAAKHVEALMTYWHENGLSPSMLHTRLSMLRVACDWMGKPNVVKDITDYLPEDAVRRSTVASKSKAWDAAEVDPLKVIELAKQIDERLAAMLMMQHHFGLRVKESIMLSPCKALIDSGTALEVYEGTKGGRMRRIDIDTTEQRHAIDYARFVASKGNTKRLRWPDCTWKQAQSRFYNLVRYRLGISTKNMGVTPHGLRHGFAQRDYRRQTGLPTPLEGGALGRIDREKHQMACLTTSHALGHGRIDVTTGYCGSYGHRLRTTPYEFSNIGYDFNLEK